MAPPDGDQRTDEKVENLEKSGTAQDGGTSQIGQNTDLTTFHHYIDLPFELRAQIRKEKMRPRGKRRKDPKPHSRLASVCKEWQDDVERMLFGAIRINLLDEEQISKFKELFTDRRKRLLTRLDIAIDDDEKTSPWHQRMGLLQISQVMEKLGQFLHYINGWDFRRENQKQQSIDIIFISQRLKPGLRLPKCQMPDMSIRSLWEKKDLDFVTGRGLVPTNIALWAIKSEFPPSLNMVTHLTLLPDCVPLSAAQKVIQRMPNLETCVLEVSFGWECEEGWRDFTDFIHQLRISAPSLRKLMLHSRDISSQTFVPPSMKVFAAALRDYSQSLELLRAVPFKLHPAFFLQSSEEVDPAPAISQRRLSRLQELELVGTFGRFDLPAEQQNITPTEILIAAGTAATAMPVLKIANIEIWPHQSFYIKREQCKGFQGFRNASVCFCGFYEEEEQRILTAWSHFIGGEARLVEEKISVEEEEELFLRRYRTAMDAEDRF